MRRRTGAVGKALDPWASSTVASEVVLLTPHTDKEPAITRAGTGARRTGASE